MLNRFSKLALRHLSRERFADLREHYLAARARLAPAIRALYGTFDTLDLRRHLEQRLEAPFEVLMVHSSVNAMQPMYTGNPLELVRMLIDFCGPERTLVMPAFYFGDPKIGGVCKTFRHNPTFDLKRTPSQMGLATEIFRRMRGVVQSRHPVYRIAALGPLAQTIVAGHENASSAAGHGSPFERMTAHDTLILGIGKSYDVMTQVHHVDEILGTEFPVPRHPQDSDRPLTVTVIDADRHIPVALRGGGFEWSYDMRRLPALLQPGDLDLWRFHHVPFFAARARRITERLTQAAKRGQTIYTPG
jgi:aminoglycoside 3-N-acetyltransferase